MHHSAERMHAFVVTIAATAQRLAVEGDSHALQYRLLLGDPQTEFFINLFYVHKMLQNPPERAFTGRLVVLSA